MALALGGFSAYLVTKGEIEAGMGGAGAAIAAATMKHNNDSEEDYETRIRNEVRIQVLEIKLDDRRRFEAREQEIVELRFRLKMKDEERALAFKEKEVEHKLEILLKDQKFTSPKAILEAKESESQNSEASNS